MIAHTIGLLFGLLTLYLVPLFAFLALVAAAALFGRKSRGSGLTKSPGGRPPRFAVVIPAHDEEADIGATVVSCQALTYEPAAFQVFVIADNCSDGTAQAARDAGAVVVERHNLERRSKGFALQDFFENLGRRDADDRFDAVVVIDADTLVDPDLLDKFAAEIAGGADWVQCYYTARNPDDTWRTRLLTFALSLFNGVWLLGQDRLGLSAGFRGNGMCFTTRGLARVPWRAYGLVEDQEFSWTLRVAGERVRFLPDARVYAEMVRRGPTAVSQRQRWEEGRRSLRDAFIGRVMASRSLSVWHKLLSIVELVFPPLMRLFALLFVASWIHPIAWLSESVKLRGWAAAIAPAHLIMASIVLVYAVCPFVKLGLPPRYGLALANLPYYAIWKVVATFGTRTKGWVRTRRESAAGHGPS